MAVQTRRWFHPSVSGAQAEQLLLDRGIRGSYLVRPSSSNPGDFTLSIRTGDEISHIKIQNTGDFYDLYGGEKFATLSELIEFYTKCHGQLKKLDGQVIELTYPLLSSEVTTERWFHGHITGTDATALLAEKGQNGSYLVRASISHPGDYVLTARCEDRVTHIMIRFKDARFDVGDGESFSSLPDLIDFYKKHPVVETNGSVVQLRQPFNATKFSIKGINERVEQLESSENDDKSKGGFFEEFEELQAKEANHTFSRKEGARPENKKKNRYKNILPFDHTRVVLKGTDPSVVGSDYINASYISAKELNLQNQYIATQGCLPGTVDDFWQMVWQENSRLVVMATSEVERGRSKCTRYWPEINKTGNYRNFCVTHTKEDQLSDHILRVFKLENTRCDEPARFIYHFYFMSWPDHGVPARPGPVLAFMEDINERQRTLERSVRGGIGPMVVHCSAGIGRTGTLIIIDLIITAVAIYGIETDVDIMKTIQSVRTQRSGMVQTEAQYKFCYLAVKHHIDTLKTRIQAEQEADDSSLYGNIAGASNLVPGGRVLGMR
eukprot:scpid73513/ scgid10461/ Tyrosine-protein phosphatase non-receptor type 11; SH-PTP2